MTDDVYIVEEMGTVVAATADAMGININYMYGHPVEITGRLQDMTNSPNLKNQKFPLVVLFTDIRITPHEGFYGSAKLQMVICTATKREYTSPQRTEATFKPVLHPIKRELINQIGRHAQFAFPAMVTTNEIDRYFWGKSGLFGNTSDMFNDHIDAIELENLTLNINNKICLPGKSKIN